MILYDSLNAQDYGIPIYLRLISLGGVIKICKIKKVRKPKLVLLHMPRLQISHLLINYIRQ